jgi:hypothetical protein
MLKAVWRSMTKTKTKLRGLSPQANYTDRAVGIRYADHVTPSTRKSRHYFADSGGRSLGRSVGRSMTRRL